MIISSPCLAPDSARQVLLIKNCPSAADGLNIGIERAGNEWVVFVHQDVLLPPGWDGCVADQLQEAERRFGPIGVAGVYGVGEIITSGDLTESLAAERIGWVVDSGRMLRDGPELPAQVATLDELVLVVRGDSDLRFDPALGFHLYGADICLQTRELGLAVVAMGALCYHNSANIGLPKEFYDSAAIFRSQVGPPAAGGHVVHDHRPPRMCAPAGQCDHRWDEIHCVYVKVINNIT
jgi:hypothetical protein